MKKFVFTIVLILCFVFTLVSQQPKEDFLTPKYYHADEDSDLRNQTAAETFLNPRQETGLMAFGIRMWVTGMRILRITLKPNRNYFFRFKF